MISTGHGFVGNNMFSYCINNPVIYADQYGYEPTKILDTDGDGVNDCYVYSYTYTTGFWWWEKNHTGYVYIYVGKDRSFFEDKDNVPEGFNKKTDIMVGDYTSSSNPNMYAYAAHLVAKKHRGKIIDCLLEYDADFDTPWSRSRKSLLTEWREHKRYAFASARAENVDFDNDEEGKGFGHFLKKAWDSFWG